MIDRVSMVQLPPDVAGGDRPIRQLEYDEYRRLVATIDPQGRRTEYTYDVRNRVIRIDYADGSFETKTYGQIEGHPELANLLTSETDRNGNRADYEYE